MWLKTNKEAVDKVSDFKLGELYANLETAIADLDAADCTFVGKEVADNLSDMRTWLGELTKEIQMIKEKREAK